MLAACATSGEIPKANMSAIPPDIRSCIQQVVARPEALTTRKQVALAITKLKRSADSKTRCGKRLIRIYDQYRATL